MDFPGGRPPWMMESVGANELYFRANGFDVVVEIVPHQTTVTRILRGGCRVG